MQAISIHNLAKTYGHKPALKNVSLEVGSGEIYGFLGPNGAGKTTTIRCIMNFIRPSSGSIKIFGKDSHNHSIAVKSLVGYLPADNQLYNKLTAKNHIELIYSIRGGAGDDKLASRLNLDLNKQVRHMSTGNKQKLGLVLALLGSPKLVILDEPTNGLDPLLQQEIHLILKEFVSNGGTVFLSSHNLAEVEQICSNVGIIRSGKIVASQSMSEIRAMKIHIATISFTHSLSPQELALENTEIISASQNQIVLKVRGDINPLLAKLTKHKLHDLEITHAPLEDIFMEYYEDKS